MSERVNIKADEATRDRLQELKRDGETWDGLLRRAADVLDSQESDDLEAMMRRVVREELNKGESE